jgi:flagellar P-ring protein precursor FlgI
MKTRKTIALAVLLACVFAWPTKTALARVKLESICTVYGPQEVKLTGLGLVVGLNKTGDGGKNLPAMRALQAALERMNAPAALEELKNADNVAVVLLEATIPRSGIRRGQRIDCYVSSLMGAKSLRGGRLLVSPLTIGKVDAKEAPALASGPVYIESSDVLTTGKIPGGVLVLNNFMAEFIEDRKQEGYFVTLLLETAHSSFHSASEVARVINEEFSFETSTNELAKAISPGVIEVKVPEQYVSDPVRFLSLLLSVGIDNPHTEARVVVNVKSETIVVTGEVEISPVVISHKNLTVQVGDPTFAEEDSQARFVPLLDRDASQSPQRLDDLVKALNQLRVPTSDQIQILRELHRSGKLHAVYVEN